MLTLDINHMIRILKVLSKKFIEADTVTKSWSKQDEGKVVKQYSKRPCCVQQHVGSGRVARLQK
jgi:hypothetical protein